MFNAPRMRPRWLLLVFAVLVAPVAEAADPVVNPGPRLGWTSEPSALAELPRLGDEARKRPPVVRLEAAWSRVEHLPGAFDWTTIAPAVDAARRAGYGTVLALTGSHPHYLPAGGAPSPFAGDSLEAWLAFVRSAARTFAGKVDVFELGDGPTGASEDEANVTALVLKQATLAVRAELGARDAVGRVAQGALGSGGLEAQVVLWERDLAAYVDILPIRLDAPADTGHAAERLRELQTESLRHPPTPEFWVYTSGGREWDAVGLAVESLSAGAAVALFVPHDGQEGWAAGLQGTLATGYASASRGELQLDYDEGTKPVGARVLGRFFNDEGFTSLILYHAPPVGEAEGTARLTVDSSNPRNVQGLDLESGRTERVRNSPPAEGRGRVLHVRTDEAPRAVLFQRQGATPGFELSPEDVEVESQRGLTAEEIIARFQQGEREQDDRLERWMAEGRIDFHFKLAQGTSTIDVTIDSNYFWERDGQLEWEQTAYYINGNKVRWKNIPELPLIQPEKVITLPLDLTLDKTYVYRLAGDDRVGDRPTYVVAFEPGPGDPNRSLYRGRVWIDKETFVRLKASVVQNNLEPPVLSNEEIDRFAPQVGPDGKTYWMFGHIGGQQVWNAAGRTFVVEREVTFRSYEINPSRETFDERRQQAYASQNQMLRETDEGFRYLEQQEDGGRTVKTEMDTSQLFAAGGAFKDASQDNVVPLAGVNYFNYNLFDRKIQFNALFAGVFAFLTASKPSLGGSRVDLTADATLSALKGKSKVFEADDEVEAEEIKRRSQSLALRMGFPAGQFVKFTIVGRASLRQYFESDDGEDAIDDYNLANGSMLEFVLPEDHVELTGTAQVELNRRGYNLTARYSRSSRSDWEPWGLRDPLLGYGSLEDGLFVADGGEPVVDDFSRWSVGTGKEWRLPSFQKIRLSADYLNGEDLDRFSRYEFSFFGDERLSGFSGTGVRFDEGGIGRLGYSFNLFEAIRFDAQVESARVDRDDSGMDPQSFTGLGLSGNVVGPWKTVINLSFGYALKSDIPELEGEREFLLFVFKLF